MENHLFVELPLEDKFIRYNFVIVEDPFYFFKVELGSANMSLFSKDGRWKTVVDDPKPIYHTPEEIGEAILKKLGDT